MAINSRRKGAAGEREFASYLREQGWQKARRTQQYAGDPEGGSGDVVCANFPFHCEVKRCQQIKPEEWMRQAKGDAPQGKIPAVFFRRNGKLSADLSVHSFDKVLKAIENKSFETTIEGVPVLKYDAILAGVVTKPGLGPLHTEFDGKGNAYTTFFISSEVVKWKLGTWEVLDRAPCYYSVGHLMIPGGDTRKPDGKYLVAMNKITKDRYLPTGPELTQSAQIYDISGDKMKLILDFPTIGEPHYAQAIPASKVIERSKKIYPIEENQHAYAAKGEKQSKVVRDGKNVHVYMTMIRSHFSPDNIEGVKIGDKVYFHVTNLEQDWDTPHGFAVMGARNAELLIMPGQTETLLWEPDRVGVFPFYCSDFCSALHQEMQGYVRVSPANAKVELKWSLGETPPVQ